MLFVCFIYDKLQILDAQSRSQKNITLNLLNFMQGYQKILNSVLHTAFVYKRKYFQFIFLRKYLLSVDSESPLLRIGQFECSVHISRGP